MNPLFNLIQWLVEDVAWKLAPFIYHLIRTMFSFFMFVFCIRSFETAKGVLSFYYSTLLFLFGIFWPTFVLFTTAWVNVMWGTSLIVEGILSTIWVGFWNTVAQYKADVRRNDSWWMRCLRRFDLYV